MNKGIILCNHNGHDPWPGSGERRLQAIVAPELGMTLQSFKTNNIEIIAQQYNKPFACLGGNGGPLIGPYFYRPEMGSSHERDDDRRIGADGRKGRYLGVSDYVPWHYETDGCQISAMLCGSDQFNGKLLRDIHGGDFKFRMDFDLLQDSLRIAFEALAEFAPSAEICYRYSLPLGNGRLCLPVRSKVGQQDAPGTLPSSRVENKEQVLDLVPEQFLDQVFPLQPGMIALTTVLYRLRIILEEGIRSVRVFHPCNADFVSIAPMAKESPFLPSFHAQKISLRLAPEPLN